MITNVNKSSKSAVRVKSKQSEADWGELELEVGTIEEDLINIRANSSSLQSSENDEKCISKIKINVQPKRQVNDSDYEWESL